MPPTASETRLTHPSSEQILLAQFRLLYANANLGIVVTLVVATILSALQWSVISRPVIVSWWLSMGLICALRYGLTLQSAATQATELATTRRHRLLYVSGVGLSGVGWGAAGVLLYAPTHLINQVFLVFVVGGIMLGASSLLAPRPEAFLSFLLPAGLIPGIRLSLQGDTTHLAMGFLVFVCTAASLVVTRRIYRLIDASLQLQFDNRDLVEDLRSANERTEALNEVLEARVQERTAALHETTDQLRAEIAQREQAEEELLRARKLESLGVLAGGIAHDFNNFLTVVQGNIEVAKAKLPVEEAAQEYLTQAGGACQRAKFLSLQLLTFAKGGTPVRRLVSVAQLITDAVQLARTGSPVAMSVDLADNLWSAQVDPGQIGQVLHNILINAREATPATRGIEVYARNVADDTMGTMLPGGAIRNEQGGQGQEGRSLRVQIAIQDYGPGIAAGVIERIFDPYFTTKSAGSGLGLATAYAIVAKHGGHLSVQSSLGAGARFVVELPATLATALPAATPSAPTLGGTERLLVMDDDEALRILFKAVLNQLGYEVHTAADGAQAIAFCEAASASGRKFDAVLLDLTVTGGMGGMEAAARLKEIDPSLKLIVSSGYSDAPVMSQFARYGFDAVLLKPWTVNEVSEILRGLFATESLVLASDGQPLSSGRPG